MSQRRLVINFTELQYSKVRNVIIIDVFFRFFLHLLTARRLGREQNPHNTKDYDGCLHICSKNNFPTAAGLASSAAGYACLGRFTKLRQQKSFWLFTVFSVFFFFSVVFALSKLYDIKGDISIIARCVNIVVDCNISAYRHIDRWRLLNGILS